VSVPRAAWGTFAMAVPCLIAVWALGGLYLSLGPSLAAQFLHAQSLLRGVVVLLLNAVGAAAAVVVRRSNPSTAMLGGCLVMLDGDIRRDRLVAPRRLVFRRGRVVAYTEPAQTTITWAGTAGQGHRARAGRDGRGRNTRPPL
jgi:hypothetical protein